MHDVSSRSNSALNTHIKKQASLFAVQRRTSTVCLLLSALGATASRLLSYYFLLPRKGRQLLQVWSTFMLSPNPYQPSVPAVISLSWHLSVLLTCDHMVPFPLLTVCFISLPSTSSIFLPSPHCSLFSSLLLSCSTVAGCLPGSPGSCVSLNSPHSQPFALSAPSLHLPADVADIWQRTTCGATPASKIGNKLLKTHNLGSKLLKTESRNQAFTMTS